LTECEARTVGEAARRGYTHYVKLFGQWCLQNGRRVDPQNPELPLVDYLDVLLALTEPSHVANTTAAAVIDRTPGLALKDMSRVTRALRGFRKTSPPFSRYGFADQIVAGLAVAAVARGRRTLALQIVTGSKGYFRPGELRQFVVEDLVKPVAGGQRALGHHGLIVAPFQRAVPSKTLTFDDTVLFSLEEERWIGPMLEAVAEHQGPGKLLFGQAGGDEVRGWKAVVADLELPPRSTMYQLRHSGASSDLLAGRRAAADVLQRGRWESMRSLKRYAKPGQLQKLVADLPPHVQEFLIWAEENLQGVLLGMVAAKLPLRPRETTTRGTAGTRRVRRRTLGVLDIPAPVTPPGLGLLALPAPAAPTPPLAGRGRRGRARPGGGQARA